MSFVRGRSYASEQVDETDGDYYMVNLKSFNRGGGFRHDGAKYYSGPINQKQKLNRGDVVLAVTDMTNDRAVIARPALIPSIKEKEVTFSADVIKIESSILPNTFIYFSLLNQQFIETTKAKANGANVLHLKPDAVLEYRAVIPPKHLLEQFDFVCNKLMLLIDNLTLQNNELNIIREMLIDRIASRDTNLC